MNETEPALDPEFFRQLSVLYVEDEDMVREGLARYLRRRFDRVETASDGVEGLEKFSTGKYDIIITDVRMPRMDGLEMAKRIKTMREELPVVVVTAYNETDYFIRAIEVGVDRYVKKPVDPEELLKAIYGSTRLHFARLETERARRLGVELLHRTVEAMGRAMEKRDGYTSGHVDRVAALASRIGEELQLSPERITGLRLGSYLHNIGDLEIPAEILQSTRALSPEEREVVRRHPRDGFRILSEIPFVWPIKEIVLQHHERLDGSGYPDGLRGDAILLEAKIVAVADVLDSICSARPYRPAHGLAVALDEIRSGSGRLYDPTVVDACVRVMEREGSNLYPAGSA